MSIPFILSDDQDAALAAFVGFLMSPTESVFVLEGYAGTGKTTMIKHLLANLNKYIATAKLLDPQYKELNVELTATTNTACEELARITGKEVNTIHSFLGLRVVTDYSTGKTTVIPKNNTQVRYDNLVFIDEASNLDWKMLKYIFQLTRDCKIVFMGDRAQLASVGCTKPPAFEAGFKGAMLKNVMRQSAGNPIIDAATCFRNTVLTGEWTPFKPDGTIIKHFKDRGEFEDEIIKEFVRPDWTYRQSKVLAWTNKCVLKYNAALAELTTGQSAFVAGDYAVNNSYVQANSHSVKTNAVVQITAIEEDTDHKGVDGNWVQIDNLGKFFFPRRLQDKLDRIKQANKEEDYTTVAEIDRSWIDLRHYFAQTINKSQGSTYGKVFIDLDDLRRCNSGDQIARMLYVAFSRAQQNVYLVGDIS